MTTAETARVDTVRQGMRIIGRGIRHEPRTFAVAVVGAGLYGGMTVASAVVLGRVTDAVIVPAFAEGDVPKGALALGVTAILVVAVLKSAGIVLRRAGATLMQARLEARYRRMVTSRYTRLPLSWHQQHPTGELLSNANADVEATWWPIAPLPFSVGVTFMLLITAVMMLATDLVLAVVGFLVFPTLALLNVRYNHRMRGPATRAQQRRADVSSVAHESFDGALVVKTLGLEESETERFRVESDRLRDELVTVGRVSALYNPVLEVLPQAGVLLVLLVGVHRISAGALTAGELVQFAYLFTLLAFPIRLFGFLLAELPRSVVGWDRVSSVLRAEGELATGSELLDGTGPADSAVESASYRYPDAGESDLAVREVTLNASAGRVVAVVGPTGAGKSTIASLLVRLADPSSGVVRLDGVDLRRLRAGQLPQHTAIVFQHSFLFDDSVRDNVTLDLDVDDEEVERALRLAQAWEFVQELPDGMDTVIGERGTSLSGGQRQRLALARALVRRPRLLIMDDATSSVDPAVESAILEGLRRADLPSTVLVVAYRRATISMADAIVYVDRGTVVATGTHQQLLERVPGYATLLAAYDPEQQP